MRTKCSQRLGVYAGSFDPRTVGHLWMIQEGVRLFDRLVVAIGINPDKRYTFSLDDRLAMLKASTRQFRNLSVTSFSNRYLIE
jgi:pantetheine-phosphate adenylyltransferase